MNKIIYFLLLSLVVLQFISCKKFIEITPPSTSINAGNVYTTDATAAAVLTNIYAKMSGENNEYPPLSALSISSLTLFAGLGSDELALFDLNAPNLIEFYRNELTKTTSLNFWAPLYQQIFAINNALEGINSSLTLTPSVKQQLLGEAKFMRGFCYFYLVNLYGKVPLILDLNYKINSLLSRSSEEEVYNQIIKDLKDAQELLSPDYLQGDVLTHYEFGLEERVRPTKWAAAALLARTYLYTGNYDPAAAEASTVINHVGLFNLESLDNAFLKNNHEAIWQLQSVGVDAASNTGEGRLFVLPTTGPEPFSHPVFLNDYLVNAFEPGDLRKDYWIDSVVARGITYYYPAKYKIGDIVAPTEEYPTIMRLSEMYLVRAEARAQLGDLNGARDDLNIVRNRAGLQNTVASNQAVLLEAILHERQVELFTEWGHRWLDIKRTQKIDEVLSVVALSKGSTWQPFQSLYPIPESDILKNPNLHQNLGY